MDSRRLPRTVIDPKVRQVGFFTSGDPPPPSNSQFTPAAAAAAGIFPATPSNSLSPVMIPPFRHVRIAVPGYMSPRRREGLQMPIGSYNSSENFLGISPTFSTSSSQLNGSELSEAGARLGRSGSGKIASSFPGSTGEMMMMAPADISLRNASVVKTLPGVTEKDEETRTPSKNEGDKTGGKKKQATTKAERRALQEAQRAAKEALMQNGKGNKPKASSGGGAPSISNKEKGVKPPQKASSGGGAPSISNKEKVVKSPQKFENLDIGTTSEKRIVRNIEKDRKKDIPQPQMQFDDKNRVEKAKKRAVVNKLEAKSRVELFRHLPQYEHGSQLPYLEEFFFHLDHIHPAVYKVGLQSLSWIISGGNARCQEMLLAFREAIVDYSTPPKKVFARDLTSKIGSYVSFLIECRPLSVSMGNAIRFLKNRIAKLDRDLSESEAKAQLISDIDRFINEKIVIAGKVIVQHAVTKIKDGDVLLIYGHSSVVEMILLHAHEKGKQFRVVVVDSRPMLEGKILLRTLVTKGIRCTYTHINAISYIMHEVRCVFLGASSVLSNGTVYSRIGTASVAMVAHAFRVPVLVCCEAYKFHERVQLDSICSNELGDPDVIAKVPGKEDFNHLANWADHKSLQLLNLLYDATPSDYVSMIVTEHGMVPPTSVPVIVREYGKDQFLF